MNEELANRQKKQNRRTAFAAAANITVVVAVGVAIRVAISKGLEHAMSENTETTEV